MRSCFWSSCSWCVSPPLLCECVVHTTASITRKNWMNIFTLPKCRLVSTRTTLTSGRCRVLQW